MSSSNKEIVQRFEMAGDTNDVATIEEVCDPDVVDHTAPPDQKPGLAGVKDGAARIKAAFPDVQSTVQHIIGEGDLVATHWTATGTHQAEFMGVPATGRKVTANGMTFYRLNGGRITDIWVHTDELAFMAQLEAPPS
jgi:steroid delta-isomerase-like uncharacterized protein